MRASHSKPFSRLWLINATVAAFLPMVPSYAQDSCTALIPASGAYRTVSIKDGTKTFSTSKSWFCSQEFLQYAEEHQASGGVVVPTEYGVGSGNFDSHNETQLSQRNQFCSDNSKTFSQSANETILVKEGDPTLVQAITKCWETTRKQFLTVETKQQTSNVFTVSVSAQYYPGPEPLILSVTPVDGAVPVIVKSFEPQTKIPFATAPLTGTYKFSDGSSDAMILVSTTLGDKSVTITKCRKGSAGKWKVIVTDSLVREDAAGQFEVSYTLGPASCHPHCVPGQGDWVSRDMVSPADMVIRNPKYSCSGSACPFDQSQQFTQLTDQHIQFKAMVRSAVDNYKLTADQFKRVPYSQDRVVSQGELIFDNIVSLTVPNGSKVLFEATWGTSTLNSDSLKSNSLGVVGNWLKDGGVPQVNSDGTSTYTFTVRDASCSR